MSDREKAEEFCAMSHHSWNETYYGYECQNCGMFIPFGCEPWADYSDESDDEEEFYGKSDGVSN